MHRVLQRPACHLAVLAALCALAYGRALGRSFVSEDFLILRQLAESPLWPTAWAHLTGPLLEVTFVGFYRPVSAFLLHLEVLLFGAAPAPYLALHLAVHVANAALVHRLALAWGGGCRATAAGVAVVFALHPLHPNTVVFVASFATLFGAAFLFASLVLYERSLAGSGARALAGSVLLFALALGSYEQAVVLPVLIAARELLAATGRKGLGRRLRRLGPFVAVLLAYFLVRRAALGQTVAGYAAFRDRLLAGEWLELGHGVAKGVARLAWPDYDHALGAAAPVLVALLLVLGTAWGALRDCRALRDRDALRLWLLGWLWICVSQAPFAFEGVVPANGRYAYLAAVGLGLAVAAGARMLARALDALGLRVRAPLAVAAVTGALAGGYFLLLAHQAGVYAEAGRTARTIQARLAELDAGSRAFVAGCPDFLRGARGTPLAQVFHWGLSDALAPPFVERGPVVYPLPPWPDDELLPVLERGDLGAAWRWRGAASAFDRLSPPPASVIGRIAVRPDGGALRFRAGAGRHRLVLLTRGSASTWPAAGAASGGWVEQPLPREVVDSMRRLYDGEVYAWVEARREGRLVAVSRLLRIDPD